MIRQENHTEPGGSDAWSIILNAVRRNEGLENGAFSLGVGFGLRLPVQASALTVTTDDVKVHHQ